MAQPYRSTIVGFVGALALLVGLPATAAAAPPAQGSALAAGDRSADAPLDVPSDSSIQVAPIGPQAEPDPESAEAEPDASPEQPDESDVSEVEPSPEQIEPTDDDAATQEPLAARPRHRWIYSHILGARYNPLGLSSELNTGYRYQLFNKDSVLFNDSFIAAQAHTIVTPAYAGVGPRLDVQPVAVLNLSASYDYIGFFGAFGSLQSFTSANAEHHDELISDLADLGSNYGAFGHQVTLSALLQGKVKNIAFRDNVKGYWYDFDLRSGDTTYYNQTIDILVGDRGWALTNDLDLLYLFDWGLTLGARYTVTQAFYREEHYEDGEAMTNLNGATHRVGPALIYTFFKRPEQRFDQPTLILLAQWWAKHRYRTGQEVNQAIPYFVLAFSFKGDLLPHPNTWNPKSERRKRKRRGR